MLMSKKQPGWVLLRFLDFVSQVFQLKLQIFNL